MYYEEQWVDGALCWRTSPTGAWTRYTANELAHRYESAEKRAADAQATVEALQAQLTQRTAELAAAKKVKADYDRWLSRGVYFTTAEYMAHLDKHRAELEALQAEKLMLERGVSAQSALIDGLQSQLTQRTADLEAVQHERDEANSHVKFLGATKQANGSFCLDMKKYHARYRCGRHRDDPWKGIDTEIDCFVCLKHALDAEREKVKGLEGANTSLIAEWTVLQERLEKAGYREGDQGLMGQVEALQTDLTQLQALVRAYGEAKVAFDDGRLREDHHAWKDRFKKLELAEAALIDYTMRTLDATTPDSNQLGDINDMVSKGGDGE